MRVLGKLVSVALLLLAIAAPVSAQQTGSVTGSVTDSGNGQPIAGAQVYLPGLQLGALSNAQGRFLITNVPAGPREIRAELIGRATAIQTVTVQAGQAAQVDFLMESRAISLEGVVVTGVAAATPRSQLAFTVEQVNAADMLKIAPLSAGTAIQGKVAGARIVQGSGQPGSEPSIMFRGPTSITGGQAPLVIVDGVITNGGLASIDALDIETMEVVKGAAAASLYGSRAQAGVIQITTKRGTGLQVGRTEITVRQIYNLNTMGRLLGTAMSHPYRMMADGKAFQGRTGQPIKLPALTGDFRLDDGLNGADSYRAFSDKPYPEPTWDVWRQAYQTGTSYSTYVSVGGNEGRTQYRASGRFQRDNGTLAFVNGLDQKNFRLNVDHQLADNLRIALNTYLTRIEGDALQEGGVGANQFGYDAFLQLGFTSPMTNLLARDSTGRVSPLGDLVGWGENPLYRLATEEQRRNSQRLMGGVDFNYSPLSWLGFEGNVSFDRDDTTIRRYQPPGLPRAREDQVPRTGYLYVAERTAQDINASVTSNLSATFGDLTTRFRLRWLAETRETTAVTAEGSSLLVADVPRLSLATTGVTNDLVQESVRSEGLFLVGALTYKDKYVLDVLGRRDGSSLFGAEERWQNYYRVAAAWRMAEESWWPFESISDFKPRFSRGTAGGRPRFDAQYQTYYVGVGSISPGILGNSELKPEHATEHEFGFDAVIADRFSVQANYVRSKVEDQLLLTPLTSKFGFRSQWRNGGTLSSTTYEFQLESALVERPDLLWTARLNLDRTTQRVTELKVPPFRVEGYRAGLWVREGEVLGTFYGVKWADDCALDLPAGTDCSQFQINDDGLLVYVGAGNNWRDGIAKKLWGTKGNVGGVFYDWGIPIRSVLDGGISEMGNTQPDLAVSLSHDVQWKSFGLSALFDSSWGGMIYHQTRAFACRDLRCPEADQRRKVDELKKPTAYYNRGGVYASNDNNSWFMERSDFIKLREVSLRYTLNENTLPAFLRVGIDRAAINFTGRNVHTWTGYPGTDPEVGSDTFLGSAVVGRIDEYTYPNYRSFGVDVEVVF